MIDTGFQKLFKNEEDLKEFAKIGMVFSLFDDLEHDINTFIITFMGNWSSGNAFEEIILGNMIFFKKIEIVKTILENDKVADKCKISTEDLKFIDEFRILRNHIAHSRYRNDEEYKKLLVNSKYKSKKIPSTKELNEIKKKLATIHKKIWTTCEHYWDNHPKLPVIQTKNFFLTFIND